MDVVFLTHNWPRWPGDIAGAFLVPLARALADRGHRISVITPAHAGQGGTSREDDVTVHRIRYSWAGNETWAGSGRMQAALRTPGGLVALAGLWAGLRAAARDHARDAGTVLHAHWWIPAGLSVPPRRPFVLTLHGTDGRLLAQSASARGLGCRVVRRAAAVTTVSRALARTVETSCGRSIPATHIIPMPVTGATPSLPPAADRRHGGVIVSRLTRQKRLDLLIDALALLRRAGRSLDLRIVGTGPEDAALRLRVEEAGLGSSVHFLGMLPPDAARREYCSAEWSVALGRDEGFGLSAAEALMAGVPVVACRDGGGLLDIVPGEGAGRVVSPEAGAVARGITELLDDPRAPRAAESLGAVWRDTLAPAAIAERFEEVYRSTLPRG